jgi:hypothetical protein
MLEEVQPDLVERGRGDVMRVAGIMVGLEIGVIVSYLLRVGAENLPQQIARVGLTVLLLWLLFRGHAWARWLILALAALGVLWTAGIVQTLFSNGQTGEGVVAAIIAVGYFIVARTLLWSPGIGPYQAAQRGARSSAP